MGKSIKLPWEEIMKDVLLVWLMMVLYRFGVINHMNVDIL